MARVYIVEDHENLREMIRELVERMDGFEVCGCSATAEAALEPLKERRVELALIDVALPGISGIDLVRSLQSRKPNIPCVMLSGHRATSYVEGARAAGARAYVAKGAIRDLAGVMRHVLQGGSHFPNFKPASVSTEGNLRGA